MLDYEGLQVRAALFHSIRCFFRNYDFLEVDTPVRVPVVIPEATIVPIRAENHYLQTSPEQCMKRLLAMGCSRIFQICPCFRAGECGNRHLEEFTMLEWYRAGGDYYHLMDDCRNLIRSVIQQFQSDNKLREIVNKSSLSDLDLDMAWPILSVEEAFAAYCPVTLDEAIEQDRFDEMIVEHVEPELGVQAPCFLVDYPVQYGSLARKKEGNHTVVERFELYINGLELANGFSELTDAVEQRLRFAKEIEMIGDEKGRCRQIPERFLEDLKNIDKAAGIAFGVDRLLMLIMSVDSINDVVGFSPKDW